MEIFFEWFELKFDNLTISSLHVNKNIHLSVHFTIFIKFFSIFSWICIFWCAKINHPNSTLINCEIKYRRRNIGWYLFMNKQINYLLEFIYMHIAITGKMLEKLVYFSYIQSVIQKFFAFFVTIFDFFYIYTFLYK